MAAKGYEGLQQLAITVTESSDKRLSSDASFACRSIIAQLHAVQTQINGLDKHIVQAHCTQCGLQTARSHSRVRRDPIHGGRCNDDRREFAAWIRLVPRQNSTGGKERLGSISKQGDRYLRRLFVLGSISIVRTALTRPGKYPWVTELLGRRPTKIVAVALANEMARIAWAVLAKGETFRAPIRLTNATIAAAA